MLYLRAIQKVLQKLFMKPINVHCCEDLRTIPAPAHIDQRLQSIMVD